MLFVVVDRNWSVCLESSPIIIVYVLHFITSFIHWNAIHRIDHVHSYRRHVVSKANQIHLVYMDVLVYIARKSKCSFFCDHLNFHSKRLTESLFGNFLNIRQ